MRRPLSSSHNVFVKPSSRPSDSERPLADHGNTALPYRIPFGLGFGLGEADPGDFGVRIGDRRDRLGVERRFLPACRFRSDLALVRGFMSEHRLTHDVADGENVGDVGAHLLVDGDKAALVDCDARVLRADQRRRLAGGRPTLTSRRKPRFPCRPRPHKRHAARRDCASTLVTLVFSRILR